MESITLFETERLIFREFESGDIVDLYSLLGDDAVMRHCGGVIDKQGAQRWLNSAIQAYRKHGYDYWAVYNKTSESFIGQIGIMNQQIDGRSMDCLAYMIAGAHWGRGYATEGAAACIKFGFEVFGLEKIYSTVEKGNIQSINVLEKIGMRFGGEVDYFGEESYLYLIDKADDK